MTLVTLPQGNFSGDIMADRAPLSYVIYIAAPPEKVWDGFVSPESNRILFMGAELEAEWKAGGSMAWMGQGDTTSRVTVELVPETEATKVTVTHDQWAETDSAYAATADGWPRILSR